MGINGVIVIWVPLDAVGNTGVGRDGYPSTVFVKPDFNEVLERFKYKMKVKKKKSRDLIATYIIYRQE
jgi:hypothetical protein